VFERFTERGRQVVVLAQDEARALKHNYIGTEHMLLGLLREKEGLAARVLESLDITVEEVRAHASRIVGQGAQATTGEIPFTPRAKKVLELALREALSLGHNHVGTEHILLGIARENEGVAARILREFDADAETIRREVARMASGRRGAELRATRWPSETELHTFAGAAELSISEQPGWEYEIMAFGEPEALTVEALNARGAEGWELVAVVGDAGSQRLIFKRRRHSP
jgi:ATP-dependent Clp protease ATP-binding subunit ClpA